MILYEDTDPENCKSKKYQKIIKIARKLFQLCRQLPECPGSLRGNGFRCLGPGSWDARLAECPGSLRAESGVFWESRDPGGVSWSLSTILGTPRSYRSVLGVSGRPRVSESLGVLPSLQEVFFAAGHGTRLSECSRSLQGGPSLQESRELPECP